MPAVQTCATGLISFLVGYILCRYLKICPVKKRAHWSAATRNFLKNKRLFHRCAGEKEHMRIKIVYYDISFYMIENKKQSLRIENEKYFCFVLNI